jgi:hypothetical protein
MPFKWKVLTKIIKMSCLKAWVQRPSGLIKMEGSARVFIERR